MKPSRIEFNVGPTRYGQPVRLILEKGSDGAYAWSIYRDAGDQRDDNVSILGLPSQVIRDMAAAVDSVKL